jgi:CIC family chloride channel protein
MSLDTNTPQQPSDATAEANSRRASRAAMVRNWLLGTRAKPPVEQPESGTVGDFTTTWRVIWISLLAVCAGLLGTLAAIGLRDFVGLITNAVYYQRFSIADVSPAANRLGWLAVPIPVAGAVVVGILARLGSEDIRGSGIPATTEAVLTRGSRIPPYLLILKPLATAISIGTGIPFGVEGPIILTGASGGSLIGQLFGLTANERKTVLVAGAVGGFTAIFNVPVTAVLLALELLLFEVKPRSLIPVALASGAATLLRWYMIGTGPMFPLKAHPTLGVYGILACVLVGLIAGILAWLLTLGVYSVEDSLPKLSIPPMWRPALGALVVGFGGIFAPRALGTGYDTIQAELNGALIVQVVAVLLVVKAILWCVALGSRNSGGVVFAPLLIIGGLVGTLEARFLPGGSPGLWALIGMAALVAGVSRAPLMSIALGLELTHALDALLPLLMACFVAHGVSVLVLRRSVLTQKIARMGLHATREYGIDPLEVLSVQEVMQRDVTCFRVDQPLADLRQQMRTEDRAELQRRYPIVDDAGCLAGILTGTDLARIGNDDTRHVGDLMETHLVVAYPDEMLRMVTARMVESATWHLPVVARNDPRHVVGLISQRELLVEAYERLRPEEERRL